ncbi:6-bladed beta-propeller [Proteiniphilum saccharofermentans]|uniref:6-bladed beta-propeller n=1 Tax=Proteiniphilum saccharofermentans TaxID=1642647 RepID=UPI0028A59CD9|nr:6-bladed beta-propeller [Proteiniphilum saccharofermentans]
MKSVITITLIFIIVSCNNKKMETEAIVIDPQKAEAPVDDIFNEYYSVTLETNQENIIADIDKIEITDEKFYILDRRNCVISVFNKNGFYITKIDRRGQGPDEYLDIADFTISNALVYVLSRIGKKIVIYTETGEFVKSYGLDDYYDYLHINGKEILLYSNYSNSKLYNIIAATLNEDDISYSKSFLPFLKNQSFSFTPTPFNETTKDELLVCQQYDYRIYNLSYDHISEECHLEFITKDKIPPNFERKGFDKTYMELSDKSVVRRITHANKYNDHLYIIYTFEYSGYMTKIDKTTSATKTLKLEFNDIYPFVFSNPVIFYKEYLVGYLHAVNVLAFNNQFESDKNKGKYLLEEDNPVLFFHKLK